MTKPHRNRGLHTSRRVGLRQHAREYLWPSMGLKAWLRWVGLSILRQAHNPHAVALGVAIGGWTAFFPILGTHVIVAAFICWMLRGSFLGAVLGTWFGNPWTYPLMWTFSHRLGMKVLGLQPHHFQGAPGPAGATGTVHIPHHLPVVDIATVVQNLEILTKQFLWPTAVGGALLGLPFALLIYFIVYWQVQVWAGKRKA